MHLGVPPKTRRGQRAEGIAAKASPELAEICRQGLAGMWIHIDKNKALPSIDRDRCEAERVAIEIEKTPLIGDMAQRTVEPECPSVKLAGEEAGAIAARVGDEFITAMRTHVMKGADYAVFAAHD